MALSDVEEAFLIAKERKLKHMQPSFKLQKGFDTENTHIEKQDKVSTLDAQHEDMLPFSYKEEDDEEEGKAIFTSEELQDKLKDNSNFLIKQLCYHLKKYDKYHRGIVKAHDFLSVLMRLGAVFPSPPVNELMHHCILTHDGFVVYKSLQLLAFPPTLVYEDRIREHITPSVIWTQDIYPPACPKGLVAPQNISFKTTYNNLQWTSDKDSSCFPDTFKETPSVSNENDKNHSSCPFRFTSKKADAVRRLFAMWDRCLINDDTLILHITKLDIPITKELEYLLATHSSSRSLSFSKFFKALLIDNLTEYHRNRLSADILFSAPYERPSRHSARQKCETHINPISWSSQSHNSTSKDAHLSDLVACCPCKSLSVTPTDHQREEYIRQLLLDAEACRASSTTVRETLEHLNISISPMLNTLLEKQEISGGVSYHQLMEAISRLPGWSTNISS